MNNNQYILIDTYDEFDWEMLFQNFNANQWDIGRFNNPKVYEDLTDEEIEMKMEWINSRGE